MQRLSYIILGVAFFATLVVPKTLVHAAVGDAIEYAKPHEIAVSVPIPGVTHPCPADATGLGKECVASYGAYVAGFYKFFSGIVGIFAAVMIMWGGFQWMTAAGNTSRVTAARSTIFSAIIAVVITLSTYLILYIINPQLIDLRLPELRYVQKIEQNTFYCRNNVGPTFSIVPGDPVTKGCDPLKQDGCCSGGNCCGKTLALNIGGGAVSQCLADDCAVATQMCARIDTAQYNCVSPNDYCEKVPTGQDTKTWCETADARIQSVHNKDGSIKYSGNACAFNIRGTCVYGPLITKQNMHVLQDKGYADISLYEPDYVDCFTPEAEGYCWHWSDSKKTAKVANECTVNLEGLGSHLSPQRCSLPGKDRAVAGASGVCLKARAGAPAGTAPFNCVPFPSY